MEQQSRGRWATTPTGDDNLDVDEITRLFQEGAREVVAAHLAAGRPVYYGDDNGKLFMWMPDGRRFEYRRWVDGSPEIVREVRD